MLDFVPLGSYEPRLLVRPDLERFLWSSHAYSTQYIELYQRMENGVSQGFVPRTEHQPTRLLTLNFETLINDPCLKHKLGSLSFNKLEDFYLKHGMHSEFIYPHPIYGELVVRFNKPLAVPKSRANSKGAVESFSLEFIEVLSSPYVFHKDERTLNFNSTFPFIGYNVEVEVPENANRIPLGGSYQMVVRDRQKMLRTFKLNFSVLQYVSDKKGLSFHRNYGNNALLLEAFYVRHRLDQPFFLHYQGEKIPVVFKQPLKIPEPTGNTGCLVGLELELIENPYPITEGFIPDE